MEEKHFGLPGERFFSRRSVWFYAVVSVVLALIVWFALQKDAIMAFGAVVGSTAFFTVHGFRQNAEVQEARLKGGNMTDISKLFSLELIDATFSIDGVLGAFAFTLAVPLIILGNGIGALVVRELTVRNIDRIQKYLFLKHGAMYSILVLGNIMILDSFGMHIPPWLSPVATFLIVGYFFNRSLAAKDTGSPV
ncbi:MAG: DUF475 domain-containing protein [Methanomicrobiaceae archaeon]|nr:DUF475 domain-containing protein [Methanomicrobiaceae archaeon]